GRHDERVRLPRVGRHRQQGVRANSAAEGGVPPALGSRGPRRLSPLRSVSPPLSVSSHKWDGQASPYLLISLTLRLDARHSLTRLTEPPGRPSDADRRCSGRTAPMKSLRAAAVAAPLALLLAITAAAGTLKCPPDSAKVGPTCVDK